MSSKLSWIDTVIKVRVDCNICGEPMLINDISEDCDNINIIDVIPCNCILKGKG